MKNIKWQKFIFLFILVTTPTTYLQASNMANDECKEVLNERFEITYRHPGNFIGDPNNTLFLEFDGSFGFNYTSSLSGLASVDPARSEIGVQRMWLIFNTHKIKYYNCTINKEKCIKSIDQILKDLNNDFLSNIKTIQDDFIYKVKAINCALHFSQKYKDYLNWQ